MPLSYLDYYGGWIDDGGHHAVAATIFEQIYLDAPHGEPTQPILLYKAWKDVLGKYPDYPAQAIGDCVSFGHGHAVDLLQCVEIALGEPSEYREVSTEFIYGESRKVSGHLGWADGSYGSAAVKSLIDCGCVSRELLGNNGAYSGKRAKDWGYYGPPADVESIAKKYKLGSVARVTDWPTLVAAIANGMPTTICSNQGFTMTRDRQGFCLASGHWGHCMMIAGLRFDRPGALICQSWGPTNPSGPLDLDQPSFSFWAERSTVERILAAGDSWALSKAAEFVTKKLPRGWFS